MNQLNLKEIISYLPYSLKVIMEDEKCNVAWMSTKNIAVIRPHGIGEYKKIKWEYAHLHIKPILRPLSDLTNEKLSVLFGFHEDDIVDYEIIKSKDDDFYLEYRLFGIGHISPCISGYKQIQCLLKHHYDLFGLIEKGMAVDINTI